MTNDPLRSFTTGSFAGIPASQYWVDFYLWEALLNERAAVRGIVELGTWKGGFSLYLAAQARARGIRWRTYDVAAPDRRIPGFVQLDIFRFPEVVNRYIRRCEPVALLCDNGNKPRELATFAAALQDPESVVVVHDWMTETFPADVPLNLQPVYEDFCVRIGSISRCFEIRG